MFDLQKTQQLAQLFAVAPDERAEQWLEQFQDAVPTASLAARDPQIVQGPDGFPYFMLELPTAGEPFTAFCVAHILEHCTDRGYGIVIEPARNPPGWAFTYGALWSLRARGSFLWKGPTGTQVEHLEDGEERQVLLGEPDEELMPSWARATLRNHLQACGIETPLVSLMMDPTMNPKRSLLFNVDPSRFAEASDFDAFMQRLSWFLPAYLPLLYIGGEEGPKASHPL